MPVVAIREATADDVPTLLALVRELADYEKAPHSAVATEADFLREGFGASPAFQALLVEVDGKVAGFALYFYHFSTWRGRRTLFLEDLFVRPAFRGQGAGASLFRRLAQIAMQQGCARFEWNVLTWNEPAIAFYEAQGAQRLSEWVGMRLDGEALQAVASRA